MKSVKFRTQIIVASTMIFLASSCTKSCQKSAAPKEEVASVFFEDLKEGEEIPSPIEVKFGVKGMTVLPAGQDVNDKKSGHHHLFIDSPEEFIEEGVVVPADEKHLHFGEGQKSTMLNLEPGPHTLTMQFADGAHRSYGKKMAETIHIIVLEKKLIGDDMP